MKPTSDMRSQVVVEGKVFGVYGVEDYYNDFIPNHSR
jgi:cobyric acid synthase